MAPTHAATADLRSNADTRHVHVVVDRTYLRIGFAGLHFDSPLPTFYYPDILAYQQHQISFMMAGSLVFFQTTLCFDRGIRKFTSIGGVFLSPIVTLKSSASSLWPYPTKIGDKCAFLFAPWSCPVQGSVQTARYDNGLEIHNDVDTDRRKQHQLGYIHLPGSQLRRLVSPSQHPSPLRAPSVFCFSVHPPFFPKLSKSRTERTS
ncbi:uncharacterized protein EI90DRAFT_620444 [Cantharellus anzutake]|uniref:uncharacterized protein n=1 Tax=Cantharellus anzutake TaxID=1750568 RepID=UPI001905FFFE|nr:uncharacterized protein EI90DRAFT_620444 [Cantharellus anzutake]KAF8333052.1 hypothetical protein EI90DRAFT_620444 [Cantharellus anzutake]